MPEPIMLETSTRTGHVDTFVRDRLSPRELWPILEYTLPDLQYPAVLNCAAELLDVNVERGNGDRVVFIDAANQRRITYAELLALSNSIATLLVRDYALVPGQRVLLRAPNNIMLAACWFAVLKAGGIVVCTMPLLRARELAFILEHARVNLVLVDDRFTDEVEVAVAGRRNGSGSTGRETPGSGPGPIAPDYERGGSGPVDRDPLRRPDTVTAASTSSAPAVVRFSELERGGGETQFRNAATYADDVAIVAYTSGTTGEAKGTVHFHRDIIASCDCWPKYVLRAGPDDVFCGSPPFAFTFGLGGLVLFPMRIGASALLLEQGAPTQLLGAIQEHRPTITFTSPTAYRAMLTKLREFDVSSLRKCVSAGEALPLTTFEAWKQATGIDIIDGIGATEMLHIFISASGSEIRPGSTGKVVPGYRARVVDEQMRDVAPGEIGKLAVRGPTGCRYLSNDERQRAYVRDGWNLTGDAYRMDADGYFWYQARADDMIISGGYNISGPEVENVLIEHPAVLECGVVGVPHSERGQIVKAFIVLKSGVAPSDELVKELQDYAKQQIAPYKYPRAIQFCDSLPRTNTGKLQRFKLRELSA
jgi:2-aminobenzoate-CoA ligase